MSASLVTLREQARACALDVLEDHGFSSTSDGVFVGVLSENGEQVQVCLELPFRFPDEAPVVFLKQPTTVSRRAHIEPDGKLCLFPPTGILLDATRPGQIIIDCLHRVKQLLFQAEEDYRIEYLAYWRQPSKLQVLSCVKDLDRSRQLSAAATSGGALVVADSSQALSRWLRCVGWQETRYHNVYLLSLQQLPDAPPFGSATTHRDIDKVLREKASERDYGLFRAWLSESGLPALVVLAASNPNGVGHIVFGVELCRAVGRAASEVQSGFRPGNMPPSLEVARSSDQPAVRIEPQRGDPEYVVSRVGGDPALSDKSVIAVGCGSLGSQVAVSLAASGVGNITLIDKEQLSTDNIHRHALGMAQVGENKATALKNHLLARFPHLSIEAVPKDIESVILESPELMHDIDLIVCATGDETLERRLNSLLDLTVPRIHGWLEPLGVGGHALLVGPSSCLACLFERDENGIYNIASLVQRGPDFLVTIGGCAGAFTPFGFVDAAQGAVEITRVALEVLQGKDQQPRLVSWAGSVEQFRSSGFSLSRRGERAVAEARLVDRDFGRLDCEQCRGR